MPERTWCRPGRRATVKGMNPDTLRRLFRTQEQLWDRYLAGAGTSGREARAAVGEPPLRWSRGRLRGSVLTDRS
jgi:hypothetical protein